MQRPDVEGVLKLSELIPAGELHSRNLSRDDDAKELKEAIDLILACYRAMIEMSHYILHLEREAAAVRINALEEAAGLVDRMRYDDTGESDLRCVRDRIRALKTQEKP